MNVTLAQLSSALAQSIAPDRAHLERLAVQLWRHDPHAAEAALEPADVDDLVRLYRRLGSDSSLRHHLLRALAAEGSEPALAAFAELFVEDPPARAEEAALSCVPLLQRPSQRMAALFPRLLDALQTPATAALVLDIANHLTVRGVLEEHPARPRAAELIALLGGLVEGLRRLEEDPRKVASSPAELQRQIADSVALITPLCEALALIGDPAAVGKLRQVLSLGHRRLRVIAANALARLNEPAGTAALVELAAEPVVRPLALAYLEGLGELDRVESRLRSPAARAEGELAEWLAHPSRFGLPPSVIDLIDTSRLPWPGHEEPVDCFLFDYEYHLPQGEFSGVGIAGPITHSLYADLEDLPPDDIYALYAGWSVEHPEISETPAESLDADRLAHWESLRPEWEEQGYRDVQLVKVGHLLGDELYVAMGQSGTSLRDVTHLAERGATLAAGHERGVLILEQHSIHWFPVPPGPRSVGPSEIYWLFIGRRILQAFHR